MIHTVAESSINLISHYGLWGIFGSMVIENCGVPFPTEGAFLVAQNLIHLGNYSFWFMYWFIVTAHVVGAVIAYWAGYFLDSVLTYWLARSKGFHETKSKINGWYKKYGSVTVLATRLIGYVRPWSSLVAGLAEYPFWPFLLWSTIGSMLFVYPTMKVTGLILIVWERYPSLHVIITVAMLLTFFAMILYAVFKKLFSKPRDEKKID